MSQGGSDKPNKLFLIAILSINNNRKTATLDYILQSGCHRRRLQTLTMKSGKYRFMLKQSFDRLVIIRSRLISNMDLEV